MAITMTTITIIAFDYLTFGNLSYIIIWFTHSHLFHTCYQRSVLYTWTFLSLDPVANSGWVGWKATE